MGDIAGPIRNPQNAPFRLYFPRFFANDDTSFEAMFPMLSPLSPTWCEAVSKGSQVAHDMCGITWLHMASIWGPSGSLWAQLQSNMTNRRQLGLQMGPR